MNKDRKLITIITILLCFNIAVFISLFNEKQKQEEFEKPYIETYEISTYSK